MVNRKMKFTALIISVLCLLLMLPQALMAQSAVPIGEYPNKIENGLKEGAWKKMDQQGLCVYVGQFKKGIPYGIFTYFDAEQKKMSEVNFMNGGPITYGKMFGVAGKLQAQGKYVNQKKDSVWTFYTEEGILLSREWYKNGEKNGRSETYHPFTRQIAELKFYKKNLQDSIWNTFYSDGKKQGEGTFKMGKNEGKAVWFFPDGRINIIGKYTRDLKDGIWIYYGGDGKEKGKETWKVGVLISGGVLIQAEEFKNRIEVPQLQNGSGEPGGQY